MKREKLDKVWFGVSTGILLPFMIAFLAFLFSKGGPNLRAWLIRIEIADIYIQAISSCVFPNILLFLLFNRLDMLKSCKGVLAATICWLILVFILKFFL